MVYGRKTDRIGDERVSNPSWLGPAVRKRREQLGLTFEQLGSRARIHFRMLEEIESGLHFPTPHYLHRLLDGLEISFIDLRDLSVGQ